MPCAPASMAADRLLFLFTRMIINEPFSPTLGPLRQDPEPETPHQKAAQVWDDRIGSARVQARNWRLIAFGNLTLAAGVAAALVWQSANGTIVPWVVQVDRFGAAQAVAPAIADYRPTDPQIAWHLARFIEEVRGITADPGIIRQNWLQAYNFVTGRSSCEAGAVDSSR